MSKLSVSAANTGTSVPLRDFGVGSIVLVLTMLLQIVSATVVRIESCDSLTTPTKQLFSGTCVPGGKDQLPHRVTCNEKVAMCVTATIFPNANCHDSGTTEKTVQNAVCGECVKGIGENGTNMLIECFQNQNMVKRKDGCNADCSVCNKELVFQDDYCTAVPGTGASVYSQGLSPCPTVELAYYDDEKCTGAAKFTNKQGRGQCSNGIRYMCEGGGNDMYPKLPPNPQGQMIVSECGSMNSDCTNCIDRNVIPNTCVPSQGHAMYSYAKYGCDQEQAICADFDMHIGGACTEHMGYFSAVCDACVLDGPNSETYGKVVCDLQTQDVTVMSGCNSKCEACTTTKSRPYRSCTTYTVEDSEQTFGMFNRGLYSCRTVSVDYFSDGSCSGAPKTARYAADRCETTGRYQCTNNVLTSTECDSSVTSRNATETCQKISTKNEKSEVNSAIYKCGKKQETCVQAALFSDTACNVPTGTTTYVCGSCTTSNGASAYVRCDPVTGMMEIIQGCQSGCRDCQHRLTGNVTLKQATCNVSPSGGSIFSHGHVSCDTYTMTGYASNDCSGPVTEVVSASQHECNNNIRSQCSALPQFPPGPTGQLVISICDSTSCSSNCVDYTGIPGKCFKISNSSSQVVTCDAAIGLCADVTFHTGPQCTSFQYGFSPVCGSCIVSGPDVYESFGCNAETQEVTYGTNCDENCIVCRNYVTLGYLECSAIAKDGVQAAFNRGLKPCYTVTARNYKDGECQSPDYTTWKYSQDSCDDRVRYHCANQVVTSESCDCIGESCQMQPTYYTGVGSCSRDPETNLYSRSDCSTTLGRCVTIAFFGGEHCETFSGRELLLCGSCTSSGGANYTKVDCQEALGQVIVTEHCDSTCTVCKSSERQIRHVGECRKGTGAYAGESFKGLEFHDCDTISIDVYTNDQCLGTASLDLFTEQYVCSDGYRRSCSAAPRLLPLTDVKEIVMTNCRNTSTSNGCLDCATTVLLNGDCQSFGNVSQKVTCDEQPSMCVDLALHTTDKCIDDEVESTSAVCGSCQQSVNSDTYTLNRCDEKTQTLTVFENCTTGCYSCDDTKVVFPRRTCVKDSGTSNKTFYANRGLFPCHTLTIESYKTGKCTGAMQLSVQLPSGRCETFGSYTCVSAVPHPPTSLRSIPCGCQGCKEEPMKDGQCLRDTAKSADSYTLTCDYETPSLCASLVSFPSPSCTKKGNDKEESEMRVCEQCTYNSQQRVYEFVQCNSLLHTVTIQSECDFGCGNCNHTVTIPMNRCVDWGKGDMSVFSQGISPCATLVKEYFPQSTKCVGTSLKALIPQSVCAVNQLRTTCDLNNNAPLPAVPSDPEIIVTVCPDASYDCSGQCNSFTRDNGDCIPETGDTFEYSRMTCNTKQAVCADFTIHGTKDCTSHVGTISYVCGACMLDDNGPDAKYTKVLCDSKTSKVEMLTGCNAGCSKCSPFTAERPFGSCTKGQGGTFRMYNRGLVPCHTVTVEQFNTSCSNQNLLRTQIFPTDRCEMSMRVQCTAKTIFVEQCADPSSKGMALAPAMYFPENTCAGPDRAGYYRRMQCVEEPLVCAHLEIFNDGDCKDKNSSTTVVCDSCVLLHGEYRHVTCDAQVSQSVFLSTGCDENCQRCTNYFTNVFAMDKCSPALDGGFVYSQGFATCDGVAVKGYNNGQCQGRPVFQYATSEDRCDDGERIRCSAAPSLPSPVTNGEIIISVCPQASTGCVGCTQSVEVPGKCLPYTASDGKSHRRTYSCDATPSTCIDFVLHNSDDCKDFAGLLSPVCGSCTKEGNEQNYTHYTCNHDTQDVVMYNGCNADCSSCSNPTGSDKNFVYQRFQQCTTGRSTQKVFNRGLFPCNTVSIKEFDGTDCTGTTPIHTLKYAENRCEVHGRFRCTHQVIAKTNCSCVGPSCTTYFDSGACLPQQNPLSIVLDQVFEKTECQTERQQCVHLVSYAGSKCQLSDRIGTTSVVCGSCTLAEDGTHTKVECDLQKEEAKYDTGCNVDCTQCTNKDVLTYPLHTCMDGLNSKGSVYSQGISSCATVSTTRYATQDVTCSQKPTSQSMGEQLQCSGGTKLSCSTAPELPLLVGVKKIRLTRCPDFTSGCSGNCTSTVVQNGKCIANEGVFSRMTCNSVPKVCVDFSLHKETSCQSFSGKFSPVCGSCIVTGIDSKTNQETYGKVDCNQETQDVSVLNGCNPDCSKCDGGTKYYPYHQCEAESDSTEYYQFNRGLFPCHSIEVLEFGADDCSGKSTRSNLYANSQCEVIGSFECLLDDTPVDTHTNGAPSNNDDSKKKTKIIGITAGVLGGLIAVLLIALAASGRKIRRQAQGLAHLEQAMVDFEKE